LGVGGGISVGGDIGVGGGAPGVGGGIGVGGAVGSGGFVNGPDGDAEAVAADADAEDTGGCACIVAGRSRSPGAPVALLMAALFALRFRRRRVHSD
jgi:MYXO-CTERM domain-containing protein